MANISIKIDLKKLVSKEMEVDGKVGKVKGIFIPYEANHVFVGAKGAYLDLTAIESNREGSKDTHYIKPDLKKEVRDAMTDEQRKAVPIVGNCIYWGKSGMETPQAPPPQKADAPDDLPF